MISPFKKVIGIDPGKGGGVAILTDKTIQVHPCPREVKVMAILIGMCLKDVAPYRVKVFLEKVWAFPTDGRAGSFTFGCNYGQWLGILAVLRIPYIEVIPNKWMKHYGSMPKERKDRKNHIKHLAQQRYPDVKITLATSDAMLIAHYLKETNIQ